MTKFVYGVLAIALLVILIFAGHPWIGVAVWFVLTVIGSFHASFRKWEKQKGYVE